MSISVDLDAAGLSGAVDDRLNTWSATRLANRIWQRDPTVWADAETPELSNRLGWLGLPERVSSVASGLEAFRSTVTGSGFTDVVVLGMGGSSLAPEVFQAVFGNRDGHPRLRVLDSTHPAAVLALEESIDITRALFIVSSKSGSTIETASLSNYFWHALSAAGRSSASQFVAVTDQGSSLEHLARDRGFSAIFNAPSDVGGRYSALTEFGLVPAAAIGAPIDALGAAARSAAEACKTNAADNPALAVAALIAEGALAGSDKATFIAEPGLRAVVAWIEQLVAESTGKNRTGIVPIGGDDAPMANSGDRTFVVIDTKADPLDAEVAALRAAKRPVIRLTLDDHEDLGGLMFILEFAVAAAGAALGIQPFDPPDVQLAKDLANRAMAGELESSGDEAVAVNDPSLRSALEQWLAGIAAPEYVGIHAFLPPSHATNAALEIMRRAIRDHRLVAATSDFGPRFLHSTGQLHKGGPATGRFLQIVDTPMPQLAVPETDYGFGDLITAQAAGDLQALTERGQKVLRVDLGSPGSGGLETLMTALVTAARADSAPGNAS